MELRFQKTKARKFNKLIYGFDIETFNDNKKFYCATVYSEDKPQFTQTFFDKKELRDYFKLKRFQNSVVAATNLAFDFMGTFFNHKDIKEFDLLWRGSDLLYAKTQIYNKKFNLNLRGIKHNWARSLTFLDTMNYANLSVKKLGNLVKIPKLPLPKSLGRLPNNTKEKNELITYNIRDAEVSCKALKFMFNAFERIGATPRYTIASTAMSLYKNKYLKDIIYWRHSVDNLLTELKAYYGGRTEAFNRGMIDKYNYYDFNSLYPWAMLNEFPNPNTLRHTYRNTTVDIESLEGISKVTISAPDLEYPLLPWRGEDKLYFPLGTFTGWYSHIELRKAMELGYVIKKVHETYYFKKTCRPFYDYVMELYALRQEYKKEGNSMEFVVKILLNSLYGKFGQRFTDRDTWQPFNLTLKQLHKLKDFERIGDFIRIKKPFVEPPSFTIPIFPIYVTAYARIKLWELIQRSKPVYCDTDSIITKKEYESSEELGKLKLEMRIKHGVIVKPKFYALEPYNKKAYIKVKGIGCRITLPLFNNMLVNPQITYKKFMKFKESVRRGFIPNEIQEITKSLNLEDDKREWNAPFNIYDFQFSKPLYIKDNIVIRPDEEKLLQIKVH